MLNCHAVVSHEKDCSTVMRSKNVHLIYQATVLILSTITNFPNPFGQALGPGNVTALGGVNHLV